MKVDAIVVCLLAKEEFVLGNGAASHINNKEDVL